MTSIQLLLEGRIERWNQWRAGNPQQPCSLEGQDLSQGYFYEGDFSGVNLRRANLQRACLIGADFRWADLRGANLSGAYLDEANFYGANLSGAAFTGASLERVNLCRVHWLGKQVADTDVAHLSANLIAAAAVAGSDETLRMNSARVDSVDRANLPQLDTRRDSTQFARSLAWRLRPQHRTVKPHPILGLGAS